MGGEVEPGGKAIGYRCPAKVFRAPLAAATLAQPLTQPLTPHPDLYSTLGPLLRTRTPHDRHKQPPHIHTTNSKESNGKWGSTRSRSIFCFFIVGSQALPASAGKWPGARFQRDCLSLHTPMSSIEDPAKPKDSDAHISVAPLMPDSVDPPSGREEKLSRGLAGRHQQMSAQCLLLAVSRAVG